MLQAIESVYSEDGVLVLMDLGSAVLSAETALETAGRRPAGTVHLCPAPLVEGAVAAVSQAAAGATLAEILREARNALAAKAAQAGTDVQPTDAGRKRFWSRCPIAWGCTRDRRRSLSGWRAAIARS